MEHPWSKVAELMPELKIISTVMAQYTDTLYRVNMMTNMISNIILNNYRKFQFNLCRTKHYVVGVCQFDLSYTGNREWEVYSGLGYSNLTGILKECGGLLVQLVTQRLRDAWRELRGHVTLERISVKRNPHGEMLT